MLAARAQEAAEERAGKGREKSVLNELRGAGGLQERADELARTNAGQKKRGEADDSDDNGIDPLAVADMDGSDMMVAQGDDDDERRCGKGDELDTEAGVTAYPAPSTNGGTLEGEADNGNDEEWDENDPSFGYGALARRCSAR